LEQVLEAFLAPTTEGGSANPAFSKLLARLVREGLMAPMAASYFGEVLERYLAALGRALPGLAPVELRWRFEFVIILEPGRSVLARSIRCLAAAHRIRKRRPGCAAVGATVASL
jgi:hypothetical protein